MAVNCRPCQATKMQSCDLGGKTELWVPFQGSIGTGWLLSLLFPEQTVEPLNLPFPSKGQEMPGKFLEWAATLGSERWGIAGGVGCESR